MTPETTTLPLEAIHLYSSTTGQMSTAGGYYALYSNTTGHLNTAMGGYALSDNVSGSFNTATGLFSAEEE